MNNFERPRTYEEARIIGNYWDWNSILHTALNERIRYIAMFIHSLFINISLAEI